MGKPTRDEILAEYYLRAAGVGIVWVEGVFNDRLPDAGRATTGENPVA